MTKDKVIIVHVENRPPDIVYIWDLTSNNYRKISSFSNLLLWHVDPEENILVAFEIDWDANPPEVKQTKWTLTGLLLDTRCFSLSLPGHHVDKIRLEGSWYHRWHYRRVVTFDNKALNRLPCGKEGDTIDLIYDGTIDKLTVRWSDCSQPIIVYELIEPFYVHLTPHIAYRWNPVNKRVEIFNGANQTTAMRPYIWDIREVNAGRSFHDEVEESDEIDKAFGDREVFGLATDIGIQLWFFNPNFAPDLPGTGPFIEMPRE